MRKHVAEHGCTRRPLAQLSARKFGDLPPGTFGQRLGEHAQTLRRTPVMCRCRLFHRAAFGIESRRTLQVWSGISQPGEPVVVQMREDRSDRSAVILRSGNLGAPGPRIKVRQDELIHRIVDRVGFQQDIANVFQ